MGYISRPARGTAPIGKNGRSIVVNLCRPRALLVAIPQATYEPRLQEPSRVIVVVLTERHHAKGHDPDLCD
ncbi:hypothetical protein MKK68_13725 [Methylobacterium sp. E-016]|uniref:hypothetical protein n=1 Tax=Methylobacterium sp. E-016 TaxID=2836556 RepID=UPI001FBA2468|nr:hypothetical protein [Methylobacterium sp. E-016]MCJ2076699.1 hypothetical protein [Methylobacterium sp. E-016]